MMKDTKYFNFEANFLSKEDGSSIKRIEQDTKNWFYK
jgi:hypothetical protein